MMTSGLVVMLGPDSQAALAAIRAEPGFMVGDRQGCWLSVVLETRDADEGERRHDWLGRLPGVEGVEVVFVHWDEAEAEVPHAGV